MALQVSQTQWDTRLKYWTIVNKRVSDDATKQISKVETVPLSFRYSAQKLAGVSYHTRIQTLTFATHL
jgi:hypothetical protein